MIQVHYILFFFLAVLVLHCCPGVCSVAASRGYALAAELGLLTAVAPLVAEHGFYALGLQEFQHMGSVVAACGCSCSLTCGISPSKGSNPRPRHWHCTTFIVHFLNIIITSASPQIIRHSIPWGPCLRQGKGEWELLEDGSECEV